MNSLAVFAVLVVIVTIGHCKENVEGFAKIPKIKCYSCHNGDSSAAGSCHPFSLGPKDTDFIETCDSGSCAKIDGTDMRTGLRIVQRFCHHAYTHQNDRCENYQRNNIKGYTCYCKGELCNTGSHVTINAILMSVAAALGVALRVF